MQITDIKQQVKNQTRYSIYVDGKFSFGLSESELLASQLRVGQELNADQLSDLKNTAELDKAYNNSLSLIARRKRSVWEIDQYLRRKGIDDNANRLIVERLIKSGWLDDADFARSWVSNRRLLKSTSRRRLAQELKAKHVDDALISNVLEEDETSDLIVLRELAQRKQKQSRYQDEQKLMAYLLRQGYNYGDIKQVLSGGVEDR